MQANCLVFDVGSTYTKVAAFYMDFDKNILRFLGRGAHLTTLNDISIGTEGAREELLKKGIDILPDARVYSSCSAAGGLRMVALGFMPRVTVKAAREVSMTAGARVMQVISADEPISFRKEILMEINPDIILLSGGTDGGDEGNVMENTDMICDLKLKGTVIIACNKYAQNRVSGRFDEAGISYVRVPNIMPTIHELKVAPARSAIHEQFINQITRAKGLMEFRNSLTDKTVIPTPGAVLLASELMAKGSFDRQGSGAVILADVGGATTDIHSALPELENLTIEERGLIINNEKQFSYRTVEGNLGLRVCATGIPEAVGAGAVLRLLDDKYDLSEEKLIGYTQELEKNPSHLPENEREAAIDRALCGSAVKVALRRHAGCYAQESDPVMGIMAGTATGRDLRKVERMICIGGIFVHTEENISKRMIEECFADPGISLLPINMPDIVIDREYIFFALGVLGKYYPDMVLDFMNEHYNH